MEINLSNSLKNNEILLDLLASRGIIVNNNSFINLIQKDDKIPEVGITILISKENIDKFIDFIDSLKSNGFNNKNELIIGKKNESYQLIKLEDIFFFESYGNYLFCQTVYGKFEINKKLYVAEKEYFKNGFIRINKSNVINIINVNEIIPWFGGRLLLKFKDIQKELEVSRNYIKSFKKFIGM